MIRSSHHRVEKMGHFWYATIVVQYFLIVTTSCEEFTNEDTSQRWTIPNVSYPDPTFIYNIRSTMDIISSQGFPVEKHFIQTEDGYILALHRIPGRGLPVLLIHGFLGASDQWIFRDGTASDLPFILSKYGFDVWLGNLRGNVYSRHHTNLSADSQKFWNFSLREYGSRDLPAMIELVRHKSGQNRLIYMGYSLGGGIPYILADTRPEYTRYIRLNILLAPFAFGPTAIKSMIVEYILDMENHPQIQQFQKVKAEILPRTNRYIELIFFYCGHESFAPVCRFAVEDIVGKGNFKNFNIKNIARMISYTFSGTSLNSVLNILDVFTNNGSLDFNVTRMTVPTMMWYSRNDKLVDWKGVEKLASLTPNMVHLNLISPEPFNHLDYWVHEDINQLVHLKLLKQLRKYLKSSK